MDTDLQGKFADLLEDLSSYQRVGVACSGGVDSTFLAHACCRALGPDNVIVLFGDSKLQSSGLRDAIEDRLARDLGPEARVRKIEVDPFRQAAFVKNGRDRCYVCKKHVYAEFLDYLSSLEISVLFDGTNRDDLQDERPGLKAIEELGIVSPLVTAGFHKEDIRRAAKALGLACADLPSNSCLATRIETDTAIDDQHLRAIEAMESFLHERGYHGCRVRPRSNKVYIELLAEDIEKIATHQERSSIIAFFQENGYDVVMLELGGRKR